MKDKPKVLLIVPSRGRPNSTLEFYDSFIENSRITDLVFGLDDDDAKNYPRIEGVRYEVNPRLRLAGTFNLIANKFAHSYDFIACMTDEHRIRTKEWDILLTDTIGGSDELGVAFGNDLVWGERWATSQVLSAKIIRILGYVTPPELTHLYSDNFCLELGRGLGSLHYRDDVIIEDLHSAPDETLRQSNSPEMFARDHAAFCSYMSTRFSSDIQKLLAARYHGITNDYLTLPGAIQELQWSLFKTGSRTTLSLSSDERNIMLLQAALKMEHQNHSYWFQLAQTYWNSRRWREAADAYARRSKLGVWDENAWYARTALHTRRSVVVDQQSREDEVWHAQLQEARCHLMLGHTTEFLRLALASFNMHRDRSEVLCDLARSFRQRRMYRVSTLFSEAAISIGGADMNASFVDCPVHMPDIAEERPRTPALAASLSVSNATQRPSVSLSARSQVVTWQGTILFVDPISGQLRHGPTHLAPPNVVYEVTGNIVRLQRVSNGNSNLISLRQKHVSVSAEPVFDHLMEYISDFELVPVESSCFGEFGLKGNGLYVCAELDGSVTLSRSSMSAWESFRPAARDEERDSIQSTSSLPQTMGSSTFVPVQSEIIGEQNRMFAASQTNRAMRDRNAIEYAREATLAAGLPLHPDPPKAWDNFLALFHACRSSDPSDPILDAGAGKESAFLPGLRALGFTRLLGINLLLGPEEVIDGVAYRYGDITASGLPDRAFQFISCLSVIEHGVDRAAFLSEMVRVLRPGGQLFISFDYWEQPIDTQGLNMFGAAWDILSGFDTTQILDLAVRLGLELVGEVNLQCSQPLIECLSKYYTFANLLFRKPLL